MESSSETNTAITSLVTSEEFLDLWQLVNERPLTKKDFFQLPMPGNLVVDDVWEIMAALRMKAGVAFPYPAYMPGCGPSDAIWFSLPKETSLVLQRISEATARGSALHSTISTYMTPDFEVHLVLNDIISILARDGIEVDDRRANDVWFRRDIPRTLGERVFMNLCTTLVALKGNVRISRGLIENIFDALWEEGVESFGRHPRVENPANADIFSKSAVLDFYCDLLTQPPSETLVHPILSGLEASFLIHDHAPLPCLNASVAYLVHKAYFMQSSYPAMAYIPFWKMLQIWERDEADAAEGDAPDLYRAMKVARTAQGCDATVGHAIILKLIEEAVASLVQRVRQHIERLAALEHRLAERLELNSRQRSFLAELLHVPQATVNIKEYSERFDVVYATGRSDILKLVDAGFLRQIQCDKGFRYSAGPDFAQMLSSLGEPCPKTN